jgi:single-strand DNA-binding protein
MAGLNKVMLIGNIGRDPETRHLEGGTAVTKFPIATSETYKTKGGEKVTQTEWHNIVMWRGLAETAEKYLKKGMLLYIEGKIKTRSWEDKDGQKKYMTEIVADTMNILSRRDDPATKENAEKDTAEKEAASTDTVTQGSADAKDDLPF